DGSSEAALMAGLGGVAKDLGLGDVPPAQLVAALRAHLGREDRAGWLLVVDNVDLREVKERLPKLLPDVGGCTLVTSRLGAWAGWSAPELEAMGARAAAQLLGAADAAAPEVAERLGRLPLALANAKAYVHAAQISWAAYLDKLDAQGVVI